MPKYLQWLSLEQCGFWLFRLLTYTFLCFSKFANGPLTFRALQEIDVKIREECRAFNEATACRGSELRSLYLSWEVRWPLQQTTPEIPAYISSGCKSRKFPGLWPVFLCLVSGVWRNCLSEMLSVIANKRKLWLILHCSSTCQKSHIACSMRPDSTVLIHTNRRNSSVWQAGLITTKEPIRYSRAGSSLGLHFERNQGWQEEGNDPASFSFHWSDFLMVQPIRIQGSRGHRQRNQHGQPPWAQIQ